MLEKGAGLGPGGREEAKVPLRTGLVTVNIRDSGPFDWVLGS